MIRCNRSDLIQRCAERGYTYEEVKGCVVQENGDEIVVDENHADYPRQKKPKGLGDMVETGLKFLGITPELVTKITRKPCGCNKRKKALNEMGKKIGIGRKRPRT